MRQFGITMECLISLLVDVSAESSASQTGYSRADLPPLLEFRDVTPVRTLEDWAKRKMEIRQLMCQYFIGTFPQTVPAIIEAEILNEAKKEDGSLRRRIKLMFDTKNKASFEIWVWIPNSFALYSLTAFTVGACFVPCTHDSMNSSSALTSPTHKQMSTRQTTGEGPLPILLTQPRYYQTPWAELALSRGYLVCLYPGVDSHHHEDDYPGYDSVWQTFRSEYSEATWTEISAKAWLASRALDYLLNRKYGYNVAEGQVGIIGHSRYGKQALIAAAFDDRITSVVARSPGSPGSCAYRFTSRNTFAEAPEDFPSEWFLPSLRSYTGREHELPIDAHGWLALIAPRRCLIHTAHQDGCEPTFAVEQSYLEGKKVYQFLGKPDNLRVIYRSGGHDPITETHRQENMDWFDLSFGRGQPPAPFPLTKGGQGGCGKEDKQSDFPETFIHKFDWHAWKSQLSESDLNIPFTTSRPSDDPDRRARILWALGQTPEKIDWDGRYTFLTDAESERMDHDRWKVENTVRMPVSFADNIRGNLYYNPAVTNPAPVVIWLHPYSYQTGYNEGYGVQGTTVYHRLAQEGFVVLAYDQVGFGLRLLEGRDFYKKYPEWSRLGRMVHDVHAAVDFLVNGNGQSRGSMPQILKDHVFVLGYSLGGMIGLYTAALDRRIAGVASFCGFTPLRTDTDSKITGGIRRLWEGHALQPLLGLFHGREQDIPYDFDDVLALIAPRPCLVVSPKRDREADFSDVVRCVNEARKVCSLRSPTPSAYGQAKCQPETLTHLTPDDINRFQTEQHAMFLQWYDA
ncbi:alpha/beta fold hydrolase [Candidatus Poribacteria bacterium]|nr:alpha/beta fold hydrolase [Candidatus Poribacteria bacterium]